LRILIRLQYYGRKNGCNATFFRTLIKINNWSIFRGNNVSTSKSESVRANVTRSGRRTGRKRLRNVVKNHTYGKNYAHATGSNNTIGHLIVITEVERIKVKALLDLGCIENYINLKWLRKHQIAERRKSNLYTLSTFDDQSTAYNEDWVTEETLLITIRIGNYEETLVMDVIEISDYNITLELSWLRKHEPNIGYKKGIMIFNNYDCSS
jgi:hypothetical protein